MGTDENAGKFSASTVGLIFTVFAAFASFFSFSSCGLDNYYYLDPPRSDGHQIQYGDSDESKHYFSCITTEESGSGTNSDYFSSSSDFVFLGTGIYYKIYNNYSAMQSVESSVNSMISSSDNTYTSASEYLIYTKGYKELKISRGVRDPLIGRGSSPEDRYVNIRLTDYGDFPAGIWISSDGNDVMNDSNALKVDGISVRPMRSGSTYGFEFSATDSNNPVPKSGDDDVEISATASVEGEWYVDMYAVSVGRDSSYTESYSQPFFMGSVAIRAE